MIEIMTQEASSVEMKHLVTKLIPDSIGKLISKECNSIFPLKDVYIRKVKITKAPRFDVHKLMELYPGLDEVGTAVETK